MTQFIRYAWPALAVFEGQYVPAIEARAGAEDRSTIKTVFLQRNHNLYRAVSP